MDNNPMNKALEELIAANQSPYPTVTGFLTGRLMILESNLKSLLYSANLPDSDGFACGDLMKKELEKAIKQIEDTLLIQEDLLNKK